jgi:aminomethyltransferase
MSSKRDAARARGGAPARLLTRPEGRWSTGSLVNTPLKRTPLHDAHVKAGARMVPFGGWEMPVQYSGIVEEHRAVRSAVGCFDVSHMGEFEVEGPQALAALQRLTTNDVAALGVGQVQYSLLCYPGGGIVDDLTLYRLAADRYMLTVNASNIDKDWRWVTEHGAGAAWRNVSDATGLVAVQGPKAEALVGRLSDSDVTRIAYYHFATGHVAGAPALISRTGYTGEDGFELYVAAGDASRVWSALLEAGRGEGAVPIGLGARDTLRLEMRYALYGNDIDETTNPLEAGLGWIVKPAKGDFVGRAAIEKVRATGPARKLVGVEMADRSVARHGYTVVSAVDSPTVRREGAPTAIGIITSGSYGPSVERSIALAYVPSASAAIGTDLGVEIRGQVKAARVVKTPFHPSRVKK